MTTNDMVWLAFGAIFAWMVVSKILAARKRIPGEQARKHVADGAQLVDVRTSGEYASGCLKGSKNIPLHELKSRLTELDKGKPVVVYCRSGMRSASARKVLEGASFTVYDVGPMHAY